MILFIALENFKLSHDGWQKYVEWSKLSQLKEVISLDCSLCPPIIDELNDNDWRYISEDEKTFFGLFTNYDYLVDRVSNYNDFQILAVSKNPDKIDLESFVNPRFKFKGFDLVEDDTRISALTNCGGFPKAFSNDELSTCGLITTYARAKEVQKSLLEHYPDEHHADCSCWAIWRME